MKMHDECMYIQNMCNEHMNHQNTCDKHTNGLNPIQRVQMINPTSTQATQTHTTTKLTNKQYETHTTIKLHGETIPMTILAGLLLDHASPSKLTRSINVGPPSSSSTLVVLTHVALDPSK